MKNKSQVSIGCASGFWGDSPLAVAQLLSESHLDYLVFDYLSEVTMTILAKLQKRDPSKGFVPDFFHDVIETHLEEIHARKIKLVANAGGLNPEALKVAIDEWALKKNLKLKVVSVNGDDLMARKLLPGKIINMNQEEIQTKDFISANAYLGAGPIAYALDQGADVVVTGRIVDTALVTGPLMHEFKFAWNNFDILAQASLAGHIVECGTQCCGGNFTDWKDVLHTENVGFPIVRFHENGVFQIHKAPGTGGLITPFSVGEQIVYEIGDPQNYILPDVICDFSQVTLTQVSPDIVEVKGARGKAPTDSYKVCATKMEGWKISATAFIGGKEAKLKARAIGEAVLKRCEKQLNVKQLAPYSQTLIETLGGEDESLLRISAAHEKADALNILAKEIAPGATSLAPGMTNLLGGRPEVMPRIKLESFLFKKAQLTALVDGQECPLTKVPYSTPSITSASANSSTKSDKKLISIPLSKVALTRSGDKGADVNLGVIARKPEYFEALKNALTTDIVANHFSELFDNEKKVLRWELPGFCALNFLLKDCLGGGGAFSLRIDPQGKAYGQRLIDMNILFPEELLCD